MTNLVEFNNTLSAINAIEVSLFFKLNENDFVQSREIKKQYAESIFDTKSLQFDFYDFKRGSCVGNSEQSPSVSNPSKVIKTMEKNIVQVVVSYPTLMDIFIRLIDPIYILTKDAKADFKETFLKQIQRYTALMKAFTSKHKQLLNEIVCNIQSTNTKCDMSYQGANYMTFWGSFLNKRLCIIYPDSTYVKHTIVPCKSEDDYIFIRVNDESNIFTLVNTSIKSLAGENIRERVDVSKLSTKTMPELMEYCCLNNIQVDRKAKKADLIKGIKNSF
jgi:hypothetical protein